MNAQRSWRDVPMPERIAGLPRSAGGLPIPYVAEREGEDVYAVRPCPFTMNRPAVFPAVEVPSSARPVFGVMEPSRQRRCAGGMLCQVCEHPVGLLNEDGSPTGRVYWLVAMISEPKTFRGHRTVLEPWVCDECLPYVLQVCPGLVVGDRKGETLMRRDWLAVYTAELIGVMVKPGGNLTGHPPVNGYSKLEPLRYRRLAAATLLEHGVAECRARLEELGPPAVKR